MSNNNKTKEEILKILRKEHKKYFKLAMTEDYSYNIGMSRGICKAMELIGMLKDGND
jgi:hypothetical protein